MASTSTTDLPLSLEALRGLPEFGKLREALEQECSVPARQVLSHHTTMACQPKKEKGPAASSLKDSGLDAPVQQGGGLRCACRLAELLC